MGIREQIREDSALEPGFDLQALKSVLASHPDASSVMLVGHEPDFSQVVSALTGGRVLFKKGALAQVVLASPTDPAGVLTWLIQPDRIPD
jgi:phosphohistidine phosphatase SixA